MGGHVPPIVDDRTKYVPVGCTYCIECKKQKARAWQVRLNEEIKTNKDGKFLTLTLSDESYYNITTNIEKETLKITDPYQKDNAIATYAVRHFLERYRKEHKKSIRHWLITELGHKGTENIHIHGIIWATTFKEIEKHWQYGWIYPRNNAERQYNYVNEKTINYIVKYVTKIDKHHPKYTSKILTSSGIGNKYINTIDAKNNTYKKEQTNEAYRTRTGTRLNLPIYYRNKIYTEEQREQLWINKLNKEERWILGKKVTIEEYDATLKQAKEKNHRLNYGNDEKNYDKDQYDRNKRILMQQTRIAKGKRAKTPLTEKGAQCRRPPTEV